MLLIRKIDIFEPLQNLTVDSSSNSVFHTLSLSNFLMCHFFQPYHFTHIPWVFSSDNNQLVSLLGFVSQKSVDSINRSSTTLSYSLNFKSELTLITLHIFYVIHYGFGLSPIIIFTSARGPPSSMKQPTEVWNNSQNPWSHIGPEFPRALQPYFFVTINVFLPTLTSKSLLMFTNPNSTTKLWKFSIDKGASAVSAPNTNWFLNHFLKSRSAG